LGRAGSGIAIKPVGAFVGTGGPGSGKGRASALIRHRFIAIFADALRIVGARAAVRNHSLDGFWASQAAVFGEFLARLRREFIEARLECRTIDREFPLDRGIVQTDQPEAQKYAIKAQALRFGAHSREKDRIEFVTRAAFEYFVAFGNAQLGAESFQRLVNGSGPRSAALANRRAFSWCSANASVRCAFVVDIAHFSVGFFRDAHRAIAIKARLATSVLRACAAHTHGRGFGFARARRCAIRKIAFAIDAFDIGKTSLARGDFGRENAIANHRKRGQIRASQAADRIHARIELRLIERYAPGLFALRDDGCDGPVPNRQIHDQAARVIDDVVVANSFGKIDRIAAVENATAKSFRITLAIVSGASASPLTAGRRCRRRRRFTLASNQ